MYKYKILYLAPILQKTWKLTLQSGKRESYEKQNNVEKNIQYLQQCIERVHIRSDVFFVFRFGGDIVEFF